MNVKVIGAGLAGCEVAWQLSKKGISVDLYDMKPLKYSPAHSYTGFAELVCSNSLKAKRIESAGGLLKEEMRQFGSIILEAADSCTVEAGGSLAVDRYKFSDYITNKIKNTKNINIISEEILEIPKEGIRVIATGPLTSDNLSNSISNIMGTNNLYFFDAASPIIKFSSIDMEKAFYASRYDRGDADYINCPMNKNEYEIFYTALINAEVVELKQFEKKDFRVYEGCMPVEVMAKRGEDTIRYGPLKPVGLIDPRTDFRPYAVVQLRKEDKDGTMYNIVGFQTNLKFDEQKKVFSLIPGLENAEFVRYGVMHRNTFINSQKVLNNYFGFKEDNNLFFTGQITGVEGYTESAANGIYVGYNIGKILLGEVPLILPRETMMGSLFNYVTNGDSKNFQPMGSNMGILPPLEEKIRDKKIKYQKLASRSMEKLISILN
ncbi:MAG: methylenetetrahydrofolate--tRNA-(uracil(54)-C(5))-methyltransferase (FADH(2)-oxidizing) TrmFO [Oscillospiraceae bacterium]|nr:methylenetetrahydrofolate--tRNA-(uracil(54)-C(5))-methyltransferase (FADH(2)-oxidizing) TrmFO [Oscillospiraceae bacterium]